MESEQRPLTSISIIRHTRSGPSEEREDFVASESPLEIRVEGKSVAVVMRTPGHDRELTAGFLLTEGIIQNNADIFEISYCKNTSTAASEGNVIDVLLKNPERFDLASLTRHVYSTSSCGICGKATIDSVFQKFPRIPAAAKVDLNLIYSLPEKQRAAQETFSQTGGLHASALFDFEGNLSSIREDVGRHNALDKILGEALLKNRLPLRNTILFLSGRVSFELMQKSLAGGIPVVAAISAPSSLAVEFARDSGQTLCAFLRDDRMNVYTL